ncbi:MULTISPECIES: hypothetical protein [Nitrospirillum]|uniref:Uncharacterized protein n=1 Tax=Nitrospirillum amazonense TaxID=28077 RepID=A0A560FBF1_9PROT|nr:hypothetical protein [Nitrospirillum amazonense]MEC4593187.1 hypothetical protein [Nitrospirillum amazonense]TWB18946.1 hypothetical protein FBZ88_123105 [Nitrospirillum amazonense]
MFVVTYIEKAANPENIKQLNRGWFDMFSFTSRLRRKFGTTLEHHREVMQVLDEIEIEMEERWQGILESASYQRALITTHVPSVEVQWT